MRKYLIAGLTVLVAALGTTIIADTWTLDGDNSKVAFGSVKKDTIGEVHHFETIAGTVDTSGAVSVQIHPSGFEALEVGDTSTVDTEGALTLIGVEIPVEISMFIAHLSDSKILATSDEMFFLGTQEAGIDAGVSKLKELAKLPGITRTAPVTFRFVFVPDQKEAGVAPAAPTVQVAFDGDAKKENRCFANAAPVTV